MAHGLELSSKCGIGIRIGHRSGIQILAGLYRHQQIELAPACGAVTHGHHPVGEGGEVATFIMGKAVGGTVIHAADARLQVQVAHVIAHLACFIEAELAREVGHQDRAEVLVGAIVEGARHVVGRSLPQGLLVELDFVLLDSSHQAGSQLSVTDGEGVLHPGVSCPLIGCRLPVPQGVGVLGAECLKSLHVVLGRFRRTGRRLCMRSHAHEKSREEQIHLS